MDMQKILKVRFAFALETPMPALPLPPQKKLPWH